MASTLVLGETAVHARALAHEARMRILPLVGGVLFLVGLCLALLASGSRLFFHAAAVTVVAVAAAHLLSQRHTTQIAKSRAGIRAERRVASRLLRARPTAVVHNLLLGGRGDVDHLVLGPFAAALETKHGAGPVSVLGDGRLRVGRKTLPKDPIGQARRAAQTASRRAGVAVSAVVVIPDATTSPQRVGEVWVCSLRDLPRVLASLPVVLPDPAQAAALAQRLFDAEDRA